MPLETLRGPQGRAYSKTRRSFVGAARAKSARTPAAPCLLLALLLIAALLGCSPQQSGTPVAQETKASPSPAASQPPQEAEKPQLTIATIAEYAPDEGFIERSMAAVNALLEDQGITVQLTMLPIPNADYAASMLSGDGPADILAIYHYNMYRHLIDEGILADITSALADFPELVAATPQAAWDEVSVEERLYAFPLVRSLQANGSLESGILIRTDILQELGVEEPATPEELLSIAKAAKKAKLDYKIAYLPPAPPYALHRSYQEWPFYVEAENLLLYGGDGQVESYPDSDIFKRDTELIRKFDSAEVLDKLTDQESIVQGGKAWEWLAALYPIAHPVDNPEKEQSVKLIQFAPDKANFRMTPYSDSYVGISAESDLTAALAVLQALYAQEEVYSAFAMGQADVDWRMEDGAALSLVDGFDNRAVYAHYLHDKPPLSAFLSIPESQGTTISFPAAQFRPLLNPEKKAELMGSPGFAGTEKIPGIVAVRGGYAPLSMLKDTLKALKEAGLEDYVQDIQAQYEAYLR